MLEVLYQTVVATLVAYVGAAVAIATGTATGRLNALVCAAAGALLAVSLISLIPEALEFAPPVHVTLAVASGYVAFVLIGRYVFPVCPACALGEMNADTVHRLQGAIGVFALVVGLHSVMDGVAMAAGHEAHHALDLPLQLAVSLHKLPEGLALAAVLLRAGHSLKVTATWTAGIEATTIVGGLVGSLLLRGIAPEWIGLMLAHVAGGFLYLVLHAMLGSAVRQNRVSQMGYGSLGFGAVALLLYSLQRYHLH